MPLKERTLQHMYLSWQGKLKQKRGITSHLTKYLLSKGEWLNVWRKENPGTLLVRVKTSTVLSENNAGFSERARRMRDNQSYWMTHKSPPLLACSYISLISSSSQHCSQKSGYGSNLSVHQWMSGESPQLTHTAERTLFGFWKEVNSDNMNTSGRH